MAGDIRIAWIAGGASMAVALISLGSAIWTSRRLAKTQQDLAALNSRLSAENDAAKAKQDYEYDARKRLYAELYPLSFQLRERATGAIHRFINLARAARQGYLAPGPDNWLTGGDPYYFHALIHNLIAPLAVYELMTRKLTQFDLNLDSDLHRQYTVGHLAYQAFRSDFELADPERYPPITFGTTRLYKPPELRPDTMPDPLEQRQAWRQGLYAGLISQVVDAVIAQDELQHAHVMTYAEFAKALGGADLRDRAKPKGSMGVMKLALQPITQVFQDFHPARRPVTWRILLAQAACYRAIAAGSKGAGTIEQVIEAACFADAPNRVDFDWIGDGRLSVPADLAAIDFK